MSDAPEESETETFDRAYVQKLRDEAAKYRTQLREYEAPFKDFNDTEREYLFDIVATLAASPEEGAVKARALAKNILRDNFYDGLEDVPQAAPAEEPEQEDQVSESLTKEELQAMLDEREQAAAAKQQEAAQQAEVEAIFAEIEEAGFERGSEGFMTALSLGQTQASLGKEVDFKELAPKVHAVVGTTPAGEPAAEEAPVEENAAPEAREPLTEPRAFPTTADAGGSGAGGETKKDWIAEAKEAGKNPLEVARERMERRLDAAR